VVRARAVLLMVLLGMVVSGCADGFLGREAPYPALDPDAVSGAVDPATGLRWVRVDDLPATAQGMLSLVDAGGPFPAEAGGGTFANAEEVLPAQPAGYYRVFVVAKPGAAESPWALVVAEDGKVFWTTNGSASFQRVRR
jgi:ribonuclease T1